MIPAGLGPAPEPLIPSPITDAIEIIEPIELPEAVELPDPGLMYVPRDTCPLPALITGDEILALGQTYSCPHYLWVVTWTLDWGGALQPKWGTAGPSAPH